jgi:surface antigen
MLIKRRNVSMNKNNKIQKLQMSFKTAPKLLTALLVAGLLIFSALHVAIARASLQDQINQLSADSSQKRSSVDQLGAQASSYQDAINKLQQQISSLQNQITANQNRVTDLQNQIAQAEAELAKQKNLLGENIRAMYVEDDISTLEMLASSKDLSDFVDKQQYRNSVKNKIKLTLDKINDLKHQLKSQKEALETTIKDQQTIQDQLAQQQGQQNQLLSLNQQQQSDLTNAIKDNNSKISELRRQQAAENSRLFGGNVPRGVPGGGGYPGSWAFAAQDSLVDTWGMYNRECVSYTAWKVWSTGRYMPYWGGRGNANQWPGNARAAGIPVDGSPRVGDVAIMNIGYYGHAMYVEAVYGDGTIYISQYNASYDGYYSEARIRAAGLQFIHF